MTGHPYRDVAIAAVFNTAQARTLGEGASALSVSLQAARGVLEATGVESSSVDAVVGPLSDHVAYALGLGPVLTSPRNLGIRAVLEAANAIAAGQCRCALVVAGMAGGYREHSATAPWTRPANEFIEAFGLYTAVHFALIARRHMERFGTLPEDLARVAALIRNNGHVNPEAVYFSRGPFTTEDVLASRMIADPFHLLDCAMTSEGGTALLLMRREDALERATLPVYIHGAGVDSFGPPYFHPPLWDFTAHGQSEWPLGYVGRGAARRAFAMAGAAPVQVSGCEFYDPFSFEVIRQLEAFEFCDPGEGPAFIEEIGVTADGGLPVTTDGGLLSYSHAGGTVQLLQRVVRGVAQVQGTCVSNQLDRPELVLCSNGGSGAMFSEVMILSGHRP